MRYVSVQNADLSDVLMDRAVLNDSNLTNANLSRAILTRRVCLPCCSQSFCTPRSACLICCSVAAVMPSPQVDIVWRLLMSAVMCHHSDACPAMQE